MYPAETRQSTVFVVDNDHPFCESLAAILAATELPARVFSSAGSFLRFYRSSMPGCLVLDVQMPGLGGLELYERLIREGKRLPAIFISARTDVPTAVAAMKTGAIELLEKPCDHDLLLDRIHKAILLDNRWRSREMVYRALDARIGSLNTREQETLQLILAGASNKVMAAKLYISLRAVEMRRAAVMRKLGARSLAELVELATTHRILGEIQTSHYDCWLQIQSSRHDPPV